MATPVTGYAPSPYAHASVQPRATRLPRTGDKYLILLSLVLLGYALGGRGFAYWGINPLFIGEMTLGIGLWVAFKSGQLGRVCQLPQVLMLLGFMIWGALCTVPHYNTYGFDALRDGVAWGYGVFAIIIACVLIARPERLRTLVLYYRKFVFLFLFVGPVAWALVNFAEGALPTFPGGNVPIIQVKGGDMCVHLAGVFSYAVTFGAWISPWLAPAMVPVMMALNLHGRAGMVSFLSAVFVTLCLRPFHPRAWRIFAVLGLLLFVFWWSDIRMEQGARELSFTQLMDNFASIVGESGRAEMDGTKEWRLKWWADIVHYTFGDGRSGGQHFWTGKGFGINLADSDGFQVDGHLRSPHNSHLTYLARGGVPMFVLWCLLQVGWALNLTVNFFHARRRKHRYWEGLFLFLIAYWAAFMANATFDVFLEGPMGGIWLWNVFGIGIAAVWIYKYRPDVLIPATPPPATINV
jgi:hypothetical protein